MIKKLLFTALVSGSLFSFSQSFSGMYHFTGVMSGTATTGPVDPTTPPTASGLTFGAFNAVGTPTNPSASGVFAFSGWGLGATTGNDVASTYTGSPDPSKYYEVTLTPAANSTINLTSITFNASRSATGPRQWVVRGSADSYSNNLTASVVSNTNVTITSPNTFFWALDSYTVSGGKQESGLTITPGSGYSAFTTPATFRWHPFNAESIAGTFRIDTVIFNGSATIITGINKATYDLNAKFKLFPNPSNDGMVTIEAAGFTPTKVEVINLLGAVVLSQNAKLEEKMKLDLSSLPEGTYFVRMSSANKVTSEKLIISK